MREGLKGLWQIITGIGGLLIAAVVVMAFFGAFDDEAEEIGNAPIFKGNDTKSVFSGGSELTVTEDGEIIKTKEENADISVVSEIVEKEVMADKNSIDAITPSNKDYDKYIHLGNSYFSEDGMLIIDIIDIDCKVFEVGELVTTEVYVVLDITNNRTDESVYFDQSCASLFIDDYQVSRGVNVDMYEQNGYYMCNGNVSYPTYVTIQPGGRKGMIVFMASINNQQVTATSEIDFEINGGTIKINPLFILNQGSKKTGASESDNPFAGTELEGLVVVEAHAGTYINMDGDTAINIYDDAYGWYASAQFADGHGFDGLLLYDDYSKGYLTYDVYNEEDNELMDLTFLGENGLLVNGMWYDKVD